MLWSAPTHLPLRQVCAGLPVGWRGDGGGVVSGSSRDVLTGGASSAGRRLAATVGCSGALVARQSGQRDK